MDDDDDILDLFSSNFSNFNYDTHINVTDVWSLGMYGKKAYLVRAVLSLIALLPNVFFIGLFLGSKSLWTKINILIVHLMICNVLFCSICAITNFIKFNDSYAPEATGLCLALTWFTVMISFGPSWAVTFMLFSRSISNIRSKKLNEKTFSLNRLIIIRVILLCLDAIVCSLIVHYAAPLAPLTHCTYHFMLERSKIYLLYNLFIGGCLICAGAATLVTRFVLRYQIMREIRKNPASKIKVPTALWAQPKYIVLFIVMAALFLIPRAAFLVLKSKNFWFVASICPLIICFLFPILFVTLRKCFRQTLIQLCCRMKRDKVSPASPTEVCAKQELSHCIATVSKEVLNETV